MSSSILVRLRQGRRTTKYPKGAVPALPARFRGLPQFDLALCAPDCAACAEACPTEAITLGPDPSLDLGRCLFCPDCTRACPTGALTFGADHRLATRRREDLVLPAVSPDTGTTGTLRRAEALGAELRRLLGRSLKLRQVSAGGCNGCELDTNVLTTIGWDLGRFGIQFVASPRHADGILVTGAISENMRVALLKTWEAVPAPKIVVAVGACAISGGPFRGHQEVLGGLPGLPDHAASDPAGGREYPLLAAAATPGGARPDPAPFRSGAESIPAALPIDLYVPGCPPHPLTILDGLLRLLGRLQER